MIQHFQHDIKMNFGWTLLPGQSLEEEQGLDIKVIQSFPTRQRQSGLPLSLPVCLPRSLGHELLLPLQSSGSKAAGRGLPDADPPPPALVPNGLSCVSRCSHPSQKVKKRSGNPVRITCGVRALVSGEKSKTQRVSF